MKIKRIFFWLLSLPTLKDFICKQNDLEKFIFVRKYWSNNPRVGCCRNSSLGLVTKAKGCKVVGQEGNLGITSHVPTSTKSVREWTLTFPSEFPLWELESKWTFESSDRDCRGQNPSSWRVIYIFGKLLKRKYLKWDRITHLDVWNMSYCQKKGRESNWQSNSQALKVRIDLIYLRSGGMWHIVEKLLTRATTLLWTLL
jgi:hypothetical protein